MEDDGSDSSFSSITAPHDNWSSPAILSGPKGGDINDSSSSHLPASGSCLSSIFLTSILNLDATQAQSFSPETCGVMMPSSAAILRESDSLMTKSCLLTSHSDFIPGFRDVESEGLSCLGALGHNTGDLCIENSRFMPNQLSNNLGFSELIGEFGGDINLHLQKHEGRWPCSHVNATLNTHHLGQQFNEYSLQALTAAGSKCSDMDSIDVRCSDADIHSGDVRSEVLCDSTLEGYFENYQRECLTRSVSSGIAATSCAQSWALGSLINNLFNTGSSSIASGEVMDGIDCSTDRILSRRGMSSVQSVDNMSLVSEQSKPLTDGLVALSLPKQLFEQGVLETLAEASGIESTFSQANLSCQAVSSSLFNGVCPDTQTSQMVQLPGTENSWLEKVSRNDTGLASNTEDLDEKCLPISGLKIDKEEDELDDSDAGPIVMQKLEKDHFQESGQASMFCISTEAGNGKKGLPAKNLMAERRRRKKLNDRLYMLRAVVPKISKMDRASILADSIDYLKELLQQINDLRTELEAPPTGQTLVSFPSPVSMATTIDMSNCVREEFPTLMQSVELQPPEVEVKAAEGRAWNIHMACSEQPGLLLATVKALDELGLDVQQAVVSCFNGFSLDVFRAEQLAGTENEEERIKMALIETASKHHIP